jgi:hypothetical protein
LLTTGELVGGKWSTGHVAVSHSDDGLGVVVDAAVVEEISAGPVEAVMLQETVASELITLVDCGEDGLTCDHREIHGGMVCPK